MANHKSALKRIRQNEKRRMRNKAVKSRLRTRLNQFEEAIASADADRITEAMRVVESELARAATKGVIPAARASRKASRMARRAQAARAEANA